MPESQNIAEIEAQYRDEWLLFEVLETDKVDRPLTGKLLCHSKNRDEIHKTAMEKRRRDKCYYITFTGDPVPPDMVVVL